jgi:hypothetical protein
MILYHRYYGESSFLSNLVMLTSYSKGLKWRGKKNQKEIINGLVGEVIAILG